MRKPAAACQIWLPAICPMDTGKIRFPAPKNMPNSMLATNMVSLKVSFFIISTHLLFFIIVFTIAHFPAGRNCRE